MITLALDIAVNIGWACGSADALARSGSKKLPDAHEGEDETRRLVAMGLWLEDTIEVFGVRHIVCEAPVPPGRVLDKTTFATALLLIGLVATAKATGMRMACSINTVAVSSWRKHFTGNGHSDKTDALARNHQLGFMPADKDESDAIGILSYELHRLRQTPTWDARDDRGKPVVPFRRPGDSVPLPPPSARAGIRKAVR